MKRSKISYCDYSSGPLNIVTGCTPVSAGCTNCYAKAIYERFGRDFSTVQTHSEKLAKLWKMEFPQDGNVRGAHTRPLCFLCDTGDLFHEAVPADFILRAFDMMFTREDVDWLVLTKRPARMVDVLFSGTGHLGGGDYLPNVWLGVTVENQAVAHERIAPLLANWMGLCWVSVEPMLGYVDLWAVQYDRYTRMNVLEGVGDTSAPGYRGQSLPNCHLMNRLSWVVAGGESGPTRRAFDPVWAMTLYRQCKTSEIPYFFKQGSSFYPGQDDALPGIGQVREWPKRF